MGIFFGPMSDPRVTDPGLVVGLVISGIAIGILFAVIANFFHKRRLSKQEQNPMAAYLRSITTSADRLYTAPLRPDTRASQVAAAQRSPFDPQQGAIELQDLDPVQAPQQAHVRDTVDTSFSSNRNSQKRFSLPSRFRSDSLSTEGSEAALTPGLTLGMRRGSGYLTDDEVDKDTLEPPRTLADDDDDAWTDMGDESVPHFQNRLSSGEKKRSLGTDLLEGKRGGK